MKLNYFNFKSFGEKILLTNDLGEFIFINESEFRDLISQKVKNGSLLEQKLIEHHMIYDETALSFSYTNRYNLRQYVMTSNL